MADKIKMRATTHIYDSNLVPKQIRRGQLFWVNDETQARDYAHVAEPYDGEDEPEVVEVTAAGVVGVDRKTKEAPLNKMNGAAENKKA